MSAGPAAPPLSDRLIAFTTPSNYSPRLLRLLSLRGAVPLHIPTISVGPTPLSLHPFLHRHSIEQLAGIVFTSRSGISALCLALDALAPPPPPLSDSGPSFVVAALGNDAELLSECGLVEKLCENSARVRVLVPDIASPAALVTF